MKQMLPDKKHIILARWMRTFCTAVQQLIAQAVVVLIPASSTETFWI